MLECVEEQLGFRPGLDAPLREVGLGPSDSSMSALLLRRALQSRLASAPESAEILRHAQPWQLLAYPFRDTVSLRVAGAHAAMIAREASRSC